MSNQGVIDVYSSALDVLLETFFSFFEIVIKNIPAFLPTIAIFAGIKLLEYFINPKSDGPVFDDDYARDFGLAYDTLRSMYDSDEDFINDYFNDFKSSEGHDPDYDELVELVENDIWDNVTSDRYVDDVTAFVEKSDDDYTYSFEEFEGSYYDYIESSED